MGDLERFVKAQEDMYKLALNEMKAGRKRSHWMWYIFPQIKGLGFSEMANYYGISDLDEAKEYLDHPVLGSRLREISETILLIESSDPTSVFGTPDDMKLKSSMTLFSIAAPEETVFKAVLEKFFDGNQDIKTLKIIGE